MLKLVKPAIVAIIGFYTLLGDSRARAETPDLPKDYHLSCYAHVRASHIQGAFTRDGRPEKPSDYSSYQFARDGGGFGIACNYRPRPVISLTTGGEFYAGKMEIDYRLSYLRGLFSATEISFRGWQELLFHIKSRTDIGIHAGVQFSPDGTLTTNNLELKVGTAMFDLTDFAKKGINITGAMQIWEAGIVSRVRLARGISLTLDVLWQEYNITAHIKFDEAATQALSKFGYSTDSLAKITNGMDLVLVKPGITWCFRQLLCLNLDVPVGIFDANSWIWGLTFRAAAFLP